MEREERKEVIDFAIREILEMSELAWSHSPQWDRYKKVILRKLNDLRRKLYEIDRIEVENELR